MLEATSEQEWTAVEYSVGNESEQSMGFMHANG